MADIFRIKWTNKESKNWVDLLDTQFFAEEVAGREIAHRVEDSRGIIYRQKCTLQVDGDAATLTYPEYDDWCDGTTKIIFSDNTRQTIKSVLWADPDETFRNLHPIFQRVSNSDAEEEVARLVRLGKIASRPEQVVFRARLREAYGGKCAVTGCSTPEALEAAHVRVKKGADLNDLKNGILLRADIHALLDAGLITLTEDGARIQVRQELVSDPTYQFLDGKPVLQPSHGGPAQENILDHRRRFCF
jgi:HNH endonuclease